MSDVITACPIGVVIVAESCIRWRRFSSTQYGNVPDVAGPVMSSVVPVR